eukprot:3547219-Ditylum_brightwellii.AAC.1
MEKAVLVGLEDLFVSQLGETGREGAVQFDLDLIMIAVINVAGVIKLDRVLRRKTCGLETCQ